MNELILYLLKVSLGTFIFYLVYWIWLRKETFFKANRLYLTASLIASLILPFIGFHYNSYVSHTENGNIFVELNKNFQSLTNISTPTKPLDSGINWLNTIFYIYLTGSGILFLRVIWQCISLIILINKHGIRKVNGLNIVENNRYDLPFSFFNLVFINPNFHSGADLTNILAHEKVHIRENHWFDLLIIELFTIIFWFNPFVWFFERSIKQNHEYLADEGVLAQGLSIGRYQAILINQIMGMQVIGITNNLSYSLNKKRMKMMTKMKTPKIRAFKMAWALPAAALLLVAFAKPAYVIDSTSAQQEISNKPFSEQTIEFTGKLVDEAGTPVPSASIVIYNSTSGTTSDKDGLFSLKLSKNDEICISYVGFVTLRVSYEAIEFKLLKNPNKPIPFTLVVGAIKLDIDEIISKGKPQEEVLNKESTKADDEVFEVVEELPAYPGGLYAFATEIKEKIGKLNPSEKVNVDFTVNKDGSTKLLSARVVFKEEDNMRKFTALINNLQKWTPGKQRGKAVPVTYSISISY